MHKPIDLVSNFVNEVGKMYPDYYFGYTINDEGAYRIWHTNALVNSDELFQKNLSELMYDLITVNGFNEFYLAFNREQYDKLNMIKCFEKLYSGKSQVNTPEFNLDQQSPVSCLANPKNETLRLTGMKNSRGKDSYTYSLAA
ncbi:MAG: hypothetical protein RBS43_00765 [Candidatus Cloacimonas sp.]|jgi:hypothetical protein|nr:hypothetical protein [Candidatus Cloacimonas sp.]